MSNTSTVTTPESLSYYLQKEKNKQAIQAMLEQIKVPADLSWDDLEQYHLASLAAEQVRVDYWRLALQIWRATWGQVFDAKKYNMKEIPGEQYEKENSPSYVWDESCLYRCFKTEKESITIFLFVKYKDTSEIGLSFYIADESDKYDVSNDLPLGESWKEQPEEDERVTVSNLLQLPKTEGASLDLAKLQAAAKDAVNAFNENMVT